MQVLDLRIVFDEQVESGYSVLCLLQTDDDRIVSFQEPISHEQVFRIMSGLDPNASPCTVARCDYQAVRNSFWCDQHQPSRPLEEPDPAEILRMQAIRDAVATVSLDED